MYRLTQRKEKQVDINVLVTLLTIAVILLSVVIIALLVAMTVVLVKINRLIKNIDDVVNNIASASEWLSPVKILSYISNIFRK